MLSLQPGATDQELQEAETALGINLPEEVKASYRIHNGGALVADPFFSSFWELLCLEEMIERQNSIKKMDHELRTQVQPTERVLPQGWHPHWIPLCQHNTGDLLCLDLAPGPAGQQGQIIAVVWEDLQRPVIASSFRELLALFDADLEAGCYGWNEEWGALERT
ncbi:hypothetical protein KSC_096500 [Ktedonobacter sp. SOSP1-52]|nr:hypothetical protein KSC_096500 [Ktedonobacter sp. SOSP1-52]